ncbi:response regulator [Aquisalimonas sp.]|uniref:response regulator n=1 Tax=Aquisalimonas sp. TaxID=1872621 RepID=UPI0025BDC05F|nr:response regulator [Aquisalimonas sp.]
MSRRPRPVDILLVEDNPADVDLTLESFAEAGIATRLHSVTDGEMALRFLHRKGEYADAITPDVILLDLNLPGLDGREVLGEVKSDPGLKHIPVVVLTSSEAEADVLASYQLHANCYINKPVGLVQFDAVVKAFENFWLEVVVLPPSPANADYTGRR